MYTLYKIVNGAETVLAYCETPDECAQVIERDLQDSDDEATYEWRHINHETILSL